MDKFDKRTYEIIKRLQNARLSLLSKQPFYALLLIHMKFALDVSCETAYTDGQRIAFNPDFMDMLSDKELEFVLMHEVLHAALGHPFRKQSDYDLECYDKACDIVVNSNILYSFDMDIKSITLKNFGVAMHMTPSGKEGYKFTVEEVYNELLKASGKSQNNSNKNGCTGGGIPGLGRGQGSSSVEDSDENNDEDNSDENNSSNQNKNSNKNNENANYDGDGKGSGNKKGKGSKKSGEGKSSGCKGSGDGGEITEDDLNDLIADLLKGRAIHGKVDINTSVAEDKIEDSEKQGEVDDHSFWNGDEEDNTGRDTWLNRMIEATDIIAQSEGGKGRGTVPLAAERMVEEIKNPTLDWRTILNDFVQEEICDYSFSPPDKRMEDSPFFLPDFNEKDESVKDILFMIDTSGSMSNKQISECYSEIYGAIGQFGGKLQGKLGFFDAVVVEPIPFEDEEEFKIIRPKGGGGTSFDIIFDYVEEKMEDEPPVSIVILTDGYAPFPNEARANGIPVLWIINNREVTPPWGKIARILDKAPK
ncbi:MAG: hypothetical protein IKJ93_05730 [Clostridia bacterium]|nr:hypothetical protein [Clostridia bacterium]